MASIVSLCLWIVSDADEWPDMVCDDEIESHGEREG